VSTGTEAARPDPASAETLSMLRVLAAPATLLVLLAPSLPWIWHAWFSSPLDAWGWVFLLLALLWWFLVLDLLSGASQRDGAPARARVDPAAWPLIALFAGVGAFGLVLDVRVALAAAAVGLGWAVAWLLTGGRVALLLIPALVLGLLALPTTGYLLSHAWVALGGLLGLAGWSAPAGAGVLLLKAGVALAALSFGLLLAWLARRGSLAAPPPALTAYAVAALIGAGGLAVALNPPAFGPPLALADDEWAFGHWLGAEIPVSPAEQRLFADSRRLSKRLYSTRDGRQVSVLLVESDDVHALHTPEYCLSGSGWRLSRDEALRDAERLGFGADAPAAGVLTAARGGQRLAGVYWFSSPQRSSGDLAGLRLQRRLTPGERYSMTLVTAVGDAEARADQALADFVRDAPWTVPAP
jgi:hypothetical protein